MIVENVPNVVITFAPLVGILLFAAPSYFAIIRQRKLTGIIILVALGIYALAIETVAIKTGLPYGEFTYTNTLGPKLLDTTPYAVALAYPPILLMGFWLASKFTRNFRRVFIAAIFATLVDVVLDPATVKLEFWSWAEAGSFYGVPWINFIGWLLTGIIGATILHFLWGKAERVKAPVAYSGFGVLLFWTGVNAGIDQKVPLAVGAVYSLIILGIILLEKQQFKNEHE
ncbi:MAG: carotenoid biosynthesis protein [Candidatus Saccharibacteria bacterium]|nr:carotenoid biosynthesis protein [Candidatus Saccharibacteria bacterium]